MAGGYNPWSETPTFDIVPPVDSTTHIDEQEVRKCISKIKKWTSKLESIYFRQRIGNASTPFMVNRSAGDYF